MTDERGGVALQGCLLVYNPINTVSGNSAPVENGALSLYPIFLWGFNHPRCCRNCIIYITISGWWLGHPSEKCESQLGWLFPIYGKIKNVPNHQPDNYIYYSHFIAMNVFHFFFVMFTNLWFSRQKKWCWPKTHRWINWWPRRRTLSPSEHHHLQSVMSPWMHSHGGLEAGNNRY